MVYQRPGLRILVTDKRAKPRVLPIAWTVGSLVMPFDIMIYAIDPKDAEDQLKANLANVEADAFIRRKPRPRIDEVQFWCHGRTARPEIGGEAFHPDRLKRACGDMLDEDSLWWIRACGVARDERGHRWMENAANTLGCAVCAHVFVVSEQRLRLGKLWRPEVPSIYQSGGFIVLPGTRAYWGADLGVGKDGRSLVSGRNKVHTCTIFTKTPPEDWWREALRHKTLQTRL